MDLKELSSMITRAKHFTTNPPRMQGKSYKDFERKPTWISKEMFQGFQGNTPTISMEMLQGFWRESSILIQKPSRMSKKIPQGLRRKSSKENPFRFSRATLQEYNDKHFNNFEESTLRISREFLQGIRMKVITPDKMSLTLIRSWGI